jgi:hypothetical protein
MLEEIIGDIVLTKEMKGFLSEFRTIELKTTELADYREMLYRLYGIVATELQTLAILYQIDTEQWLFEEVFPYEDFDETLDALNADFAVNPTYYTGKTDG